MPATIPGLSPGTGMTLESGSKGGRGAAVLDPLGAGGVRKCRAAVAAPLPTLQAIAIDRKQV